MFLKFWIILEITSAVESSFIDLGFVSTLQNRCPKQLFGKFPGNSASIIKNDSTMDVLLESFQKFLEEQFSRNTNGWVLPKIQTPFFLEHQWPTLDEQEIAQK